MKEVPLLNALDTETGLGYPIVIIGSKTPLIENIAFTLHETNSIAFNERDKICLEILQKAHLFNDYSVDIKDFISNKPKPNWDSLPPSFSAMFRVTNFEKNEIFLESVGGSSAINLLGRFAHTDKQIHEIISKIANEEQKNNPDVIFAEIAHNPENRTGNIISHPAFRDYEIPIVSSSNPNVKHSIALCDLLLSVRNNRIILRSKKLDKEIIPRLSNAHNFPKSELPIYRFLCDLQTQNNNSSLSFNWGSLSDNFLFLPRITHDNTILSLATWKLPKSELLILTKNKNAYLLLPEFLKKWKIPNQVVIADRDNELFIDFSNDLSVEVFLDVIRKKESIVLKEFLFDENTPIVDENGKRYTNQFIASFVKDEAVYKRKSFSHESNIEVKREFTPGSKWVYLKYYCGTNTADNLLSDIIKPIADKFLKEQIIDKWFFIRYRDEDEHLRVRFHITNTKYLSEVMQTNSGYTQKYIDQGLIWKVQTDTYIREIERYGAATMELSEQLFFYDSEAISIFLSSIDETTDTNIRWLWGIKAIDTLMNCFGLELEDKKKLMEQLKIAFANEFKLEKPSKLQVDKNYRKYSKQICSALDNNLEENPLYSYLNIIEDYQINILKIAPNIILRTSNSSDLWSYLKSYIHMHINRLLKSSQRLNEMVIYDYIYRYYRSLMARGNK